MGLRLQLYATIHIGGYGSRGSPGRRSFVGWAKARLRRAHHPCRDTAGGHASLCPPYEFVALLLAMTTRYDSAISPRLAPELLYEIPSKRKRAQGMPGARCAR